MILCGAVTDQPGKDRRYPGSHKELEHSWYIIRLSERNEKGRLRRGAVDVFASLEVIIDKEIIQRAAESTNARDKMLLWFSLLLY